MLVSNIILIKHVVNTNLKIWGAPRKFLLGSFCVNWSIWAHWLSAHQLLRRVVNPTHPWRMTYSEEFIKLACLFGLMHRFMDFGLYWYPLRLFGGQKTTRAIHRTDICRTDDSNVIRCEELFRNIYQTLPTSTLEARESIATAVILSFSWAFTPVSWMKSESLSMCSLCLRTCGLKS